MSATDRDFGARLRPGARLGRFELVRALGAGGMGVVYLARDTLLDVEVALKILNPSIAQGEGLERFRREVLLARRVTHPGVCRLFDIHSDEGLYYLSMEVVQGPTLQQVLREAGLLDPPLAVALVRAACLAMAAAHAHDVVHRDLKPGNLIVRGPERVTILDFGLSKARDQRDITEAGFQVGTMHYMSPEVVRGDEASKRSDIYSLGVILYECLCGRLPFDGTNVLDLQLAIIEGRALPPRRFVPGLSDDLEQIVLQAMQLDPAQRFGTCAALERALGSLRLGPLEPAWARARRSDALSKLPSERTSLAAPTLQDLPDPEADRPTLAPTPALAPAPRPAARPARAIDPVDAEATIPTRIEPELALAVQQPQTPPQVSGRRGSRPEVDAEATVPTLLDAALELPAPQPTGRAPVAPLAREAAPGAPLTQDTLRVARPRQLAPRPASNRRWLWAGGLVVLALGVVLGVTLTRAGTPSSDPAELGARTEPDAGGSPAPADPLPAAEPPPLVATPVVESAPTPDAGVASTRPAAAVRREPTRRPAGQRSRWDTLDQPPPLVPLAETPPAAIDDDGPRTGTARQERRRLRQEVQAAMRARGVRPGDAPPVDAALAELAQAVREGRLDDAQLWHARAFDALDAVVIDRRFVEAKLLRFNQHFDQAGSPRGEERLIALSQDSLDAIDRGDYALANRQLNQALELLQRRARP